MTVHQSKVRFTKKYKKSQFKGIHLFPNRKSIKEKRRKSFSQLEKVGLLSTKVEQIRKISMTSTKKRVELAFVTSLYRVIQVLGHFPTIIPDITKSSNISLPHSLSPTTRIGLQEKNFSMNNSVWKNPKMASHIGIDVSHCRIVNSI